ncbi:segregation and condensation protein A [Cohnella xylanilytica]|uniref:Segregation and condensation protein A n=1 Tax=Cohnella xylanilytica TaxID=557555 RepID=A0A841TPA6_9BACL|nr:segregation/condensation protein A [Cohnella xylanilytica]MBB6690117.1 segregation/condensation protein A [Cohnella xylanilytica]GIO11738.1 segregation and condensation protein A [Cohnella xylanilytica]
MTVLYKLETFEGPLDLLLHLIDKAEIDIQDISISEITDQYIEYLDAMQELELDVTSEFLVMAATLLAMKSRMLLPKPPVTDEPWVTVDEDEDLDPREELIRKLIEYRKYKAIASQLREQEYERSLVFTRDPADLAPFVPDVPRNPVEGLHVDDLVRAFRKVLRRVAGRNRISAIQRDEISIKDRIRDIMDALKTKAAEGESKVLFSSLIGERMDRQEVVVTFLAILELMKRRWIACYQNHLFDEIVLSWTGKEVAEDGLFEIEIDS